MQPAKPSILCTGTVDPSLPTRPEYKNVEIDIISFTGITANTDEQSQQEIKDIISKKAFVVFTSTNAISAVSTLLEKDQVPDWNIYCLAQAGYECVNKHFGSGLIRQTASNAAELAEKIISEGNITEVVFFCGNLRRDELPHRLRQNNIKVREITVYQTTLLPTKVGNTYDAVLFFSPAAAESFFELNKPAAQTILFAIGSTTADTVKKYSNNKLIIGDEPGKEQLLYKAVQSLAST